VDEKGRIFLPAEFRRKLPAETEDTLVVVKGLDGCLTAYPQHAWGEIANKMMRLPQTDAKVRVFIRGMLSQAAEVKLDRQGRANLPRKLLDRVGITDRVVVIGALDKIELWNPEVWAQFMQQADSALEEVAETLEL
jgi:MraZ protein